MDLVESITWEGKQLATIIRAELAPDKTTFITPNSSNLQVGYVVYPAGGEIVRHVHRPMERHISGTWEVLVLRKGRCEVDIYNDDRQIVATRELRQGDIFIISGGGHGFRLLEDTILLEVKQGPYTGLEEKERF